MKESLQKKPNTRMIHVRIPEDLHKRLRIRAAETEVTMQDWVAMAIKHELDRPTPKID
jgi:predicted HicB family RNase H-like nuclease